MSQPIAIGGPYGFMSPVQDPRYLEGLKVRRDVVRRLCSTLEEFLAFDLDLQIKSAENAPVQQMPRVTVEMLTQAVQRRDEIQKGIIYLSTVEYGAGDLPTRSIGSLSSLSLLTRPRTATGEIRRHALTTKRLLACPSSLFPLLRWTSDPPSVWDIVGWPMFLARFTAFARRPRFHIVPFSPALDHTTGRQLFSSVFVAAVLKYIIPIQNAIEAVNDMCDEMPEKPAAFLRTIQIPDLERQSQYANQEIERLQALLENKVYRLRCTACAETFQIFGSTIPEDMLAPKYEDMNPALAESLKHFHKMHEGHALEAVLEDAMP